jgi:hypothetical protein
MLASSPPAEKSMSDRIDHGKPDRSPEDRPKGAHPLFWLLVLAALLAFGWTFYNRHAGTATPALINPELAPTVPERKDAASPPPAPAPRR